MQGLSVDQQYPSIDGLEKDRQSVRIISPAYADRGSELTAILQYVYQSVVFSGLQMKQYSRLLAEIGVAEMHHMELLGEMLLQLGAKPVYTSRPPHLFDFYSTGAVNYTVLPEEMIRADIRGETEAIRTYREMVCRLQNEKVAAVISRIILDEELHLSTLHGILDEMTGCK